jgi:hypothetical protein
LLQGCPVHEMALAHPDADVNHAHELLGRSRLKLEQGFDISAFIVASN